MINKLGQSISPQVAVWDTPEGGGDVPGKNPQSIGGHQKICPIKQQISESDIRRNIVHYLKTGDMCDFMTSFNVDHVKEYLNFAKDNNIQDIKRVCEERLLSVLQPHDSVKMFLFSRAYELKRLEDKCLRFIEIHFEMLSKTPEFQHLGENDLLELFQLTQIIENETTYQALENWYEYEKEPREKGYSRIKNFLDKNRVTTVIKNCLPRRRKGDNQYIAMFTCHKYNYEARPFVVIMELGTFSWTKQKLNKIENCGPEFTVCVDQNDVSCDPYVYFSGGKEKSSRRVFRGDAIMGTWKERRKLKEGRSRHCMVAVNGRIYVMGGFKDITGSNISSIEEFDFDDSHSVSMRGSHKDWKIVGHLIHNVRSAGCVVYDNRVYIFGGVLEDKTSVPYIQMFIPKTGEVKVVGHLPVDCCCSKVVVLNSCIYIVSAQGHCIQFNPKNRACQLLSSHPLKIRHFAIFTEGEDIFTAGGCYGDYTCIKDIYRYNVRLNTWDKLNYFLPEVMAVYGHCTIKMQHDCQLVPLIKMRR